MTPQLPPKLETLDVDKLIDDSACSGPYRVLEECLAESER